MLQDRFVIAGVAALSAVATAGWLRTPAPAPQAAMVPAGYVSTYQNGAMVPGMAPQGMYPMPLTAQQAAYPLPQQFSAPATTVYQQEPVRVVRTRRAAPVRYSDSYRNRRYVDYDDREYRRTRSTKASVGIVAGSAAAGAAIGALTGGGKGAAIGALTGGGAGFLYDRLTRNR